MKHNFLVISFLIILPWSAATAENSVWVNTYSRTMLSYNVSEFDSISTVAPTAEEQRDGKLWVYFNGAVKDTIGKSDMSNAGGYGSVTDICGRTYPVVKIGTQHWMAENLKCDKYDTESEMAGTTIYATGEYRSTYTPYYTDATNPKTWATAAAKYLKSEQIAKFGYLYNWAAAVGIPDGKNYKSDFEGDRQGICPNGWHVPTKDDFKILSEFLVGNSGGSGAGIKLKSLTGWYNTDDSNVCLDEYGFNALPTGYSEGSGVIYSGGAGSFISASYYDQQKSYTLNKGLHGSSDSFFNSRGYRWPASPLRCLKND